MADNIIEKLMVSIGVDSKGLESGIQNAVKKSAVSLKSAIGTFVAPVMGALLSGQFIKQTYEEIMQVDHLSAALGVNVERLQMWQGAAKDAGSSGEALGNLWQKMNQQMTQAALEGKGTLADLAEKGVVPALKTIDGKIKDTDTYLLELSDTLKNMDAQTASGIGRQLGIRDHNLLNFFMQGSGEINQQLNHIKELGVYTKRDVDIAREFDNALNDVTRVMKMSLVPVFRLITPLLSAMGRGMVYLSKHWRAFIPVVALVSGIIMKSLIPSIVALGKALFGFVLANPYVAALVALFVALGLVIEDVLVWMEGGESVIGEFLGSFDEFSAKAIEAFNTAKTAAQNFFRPVAEWADRLKEKLLSLWNFIKDIPNKIKSVGLSALNLTARTGGGNTDNSNHNTEVQQNFTFNGVKDGQDAARLVKENPVPAVNGAY